MAEAISQPTSPSGVNGPLPDELRRFNWGAFLLSWIWSVGNKVWIGVLLLVFSLLAMVPSVSSLFSFLGLAGCITLGFKGNALAWRYRKFESVEQFNNVQRAWVRWGVIIFILVFAATIALFVFVIPNLGGSLNNPVPQVT